MFNFLHKYYFLQTSFKHIYLTAYKNFIFTNQLDFIKFIKDKQGR